MEKCKLGLIYAGSIIKNKIFEWSSIDFTKPIQIFIQPNTDCNSRCVMCSYRTEPEASIELSAETWISALKKMKQIFGSIKVCFAGGEVLLKKDIFNILQFCSDNDISWGLVSNGIALNQTIINKLLDLKPFNIQVSLDTLDSDKYAYVRGVPLFSQVIENIRSLAKIKQERKSNVILGIKTIVTNELKELPELARFTKDAGFSGITYQPVFPSNPIALQMFNTVDKKQLQNVIDELILLRHQGYNILNSDRHIRSWLPYFNGQSDNKGCNVQLRSMYIFANGDLKICEFDDLTIGNIQEQNFPIQIYSKSAQKRKKELLNCDKLCLFCVRRSLAEYMELFLKFGKKQQLKQ